MHDYKKLEVWVKSMDLAERIYKLTEQFPAEEKFGIISQMRRCAVSVSSNIAEGAGRNSPKEFGQFLSIAQGSIFELETQLLLCRRLNYFEDKIERILLEDLASVSKMIHSLRKSILGH